MEEIIKLDNISQFNTMRGIETFHPLVSVIDFSKMKVVTELAFRTGLAVADKKERIVVDKPLENK